jgi:peptidoglycan hydrolase-like amidase
MSYHAKPALGATDAAKHRRYGRMGIAASGVVLYYLSHKNYLVAGLYSAIAAGYFASMSDYKEGEVTPLPTVALGVTQDQQRVLIDIPEEQLKKMDAEARLSLVLRRQEVKAAESSARWDAISTAVMVAAPVAAFIGIDQLSKKGK